MRCIMVYVRRRRTRKVHARYYCPAARHVVVIIIGNNGIGNIDIGCNSIGSNVSGSIYIGSSQRAERKSCKSYKNSRYYCFAKHFSSKFKTQNPKNTIPLFLQATR